jgi:hypothetical protein
MTDKKVLLFSFYWKEERMWVWKEQWSISRRGRSGEQRRKERSAEEEGAISRRGRSERQKRKERAAEEEGATTYWNEERASYRR